MSMALLVSTLPERLNTLALRRGVRRQIARRHRDECADRVHRKDLCRVRDWNLDAARTLRPSVGCSWKAVDGIGIVEVRDPRDPGIYVLGAVRVRSAHRRYQESEKDGPGAVGRHVVDTGVRRRLEDHAAIPPDVERLGQRLRDHEIVIRARVNGSLCDRVQECTPHLGADLAVDGEVRSGFELHHCRLGRDAGASSTEGGRELSWRRGETRLETAGLGIAGDGRRISRLGGECLLGSRGRTAGTSWHKAVGEIVELGE